MNRAGFSFSALLFACCAAAIPSYDSAGRLAYLPTQGPAETVAETDAAPYSGAELTVKLELLNDTLNASVAEDGDAAAGISAFLVQGSAGTMGLETREAGAQFDGIWGHLT